MTPSIPSSSAPASRLWPVAIAMTVALVAARAVVAVMAAGAGKDAIGLDIAASLLALVRSTLLVGVTFWAARRLRAPGRPMALGWAAICAGLALGMVGDCWWSYFLVRDHRFPSESIADYFFLPMYPLLLVGVLSLPRARRGRDEWLGLASEFGIVLLGAFSLQWNWFIAPNLGDGGTGRILSVALYPMCDLLVLWSALVALFARRDPVMGTVSRFLAAGAACVVVADTIYGLQVAAGTFRFAGGVGILWILAGCLLGLAAVRHALAADRLAPALSSDAKPGSHRAYLSTLAAAGVVAAWSVTVRAGGGTNVPDVLLLIMILLVLARLGLEIARASRLADELRSTNLDLDRRVQLRTAELKAVNDQLMRGIAENLELEGHLRQAAKVEALGRLAAGIAHDFNNVLTVITGYASMIQLGLKERPEQEAQMRMVVTAAERAATLTGQLLAFGRQAEAAPRDIDPMRVVDEVAQMLHPLLGKRIALTVRSGAAPSVVRIDPGHLHQVLMNLALNARDALGGAGTIGISVTAEGPSVRIAVVDSGHGMDEQTRARIFEPFFTTKSIGTGTGLGLATALAIARQAGGSITVDSRPGTGSTFTLLLPCVEPASAP